MTDEISRNCSTRISLSMIMNKKVVYQARKKEKDEIRLRMETNRVDRREEMIRGKEERTEARAGKFRTLRLLPMHTH